MIRRIALLLVVLAPAVLLATGCGQYGKKYSGGDDANAAPAGEETPVTDEEFDEAARKRDGCTELKEYESEGADHLDTSEQSTFEHNPPHSGDHWNDLAAEAPAPWGLYDKELQEEQWVHNLEHGHILMLHKGLSKAEEEELLDHARINAYHLMVIPRKANPKKGVYYTAWTAQIYCERPSEAALQLMIDEWRDAGPELFTDDPSVKSEQKDA